MLPYVTFAYNTAVQETTGLTPFALIYGREVTANLDAMFPHVNEGDPNPDVAIFQQRAEEARQLARLRTARKQATDARLYNLRHCHQEYTHGDLAWLWARVRRRGLSEKLLRRYFDPYKIVRRVGPLNYEIIPDGVTDSQRRSVRSEIVHVVRLKPYYAR